MKCSFKVPLTISVFVIALVLVAWFILWIFQEHDELSNPLFINNKPSARDNDDDEISAASFININDEHRYDILIIGAGITGLTHSHLLSTESDYAYSTLTVERFNRVCGRTHSSTLTHKNKEITFEHGAMRFYYNTLHQKMLHRMNLCNNFVDFYHDFFGTINNSSNFLFRNELKIGADELDRFYRDIYNFDEHEIGWLYDSNLPQQIGYYQIIEENDGIHRRADFWDRWTLKGILVKHWTEMAFFKKILNVSSEYYQFEDRASQISKDANVGYEFQKWAKKYFHQQSPFGEDDIFPMNDDDDNDDNDDNLFSDYDDDEQYDLHQLGGASVFMNDIEETPKMYTLDIGYDSICKRLYENITKYDENSFLFGYDVIGIEYNHNDDVDGDTDGDSDSDDTYKYIIKLQDVHDRDVITTVYAKEIISTIPPAQLNVLLPNIEPFNDNNNNKQTVDDLVHSVSKIAAYKVSLIYDDPWWIDTDLPKYAGHLLTDIDIQTFLMEDSWTNETLTVVHFYIFGDKQSNLWHRLQLLNDPYIASINISVNNGDTLLLSSKFVVDEAIKQLKKLTLINNIPLPLAAYSSPLGHNISMNDGVYYWKAGYDVNYVLDNIIKPIENEDIYITTSSISPYQGWMYGGIWAAVQNLKQNFGLQHLLKNQDQCLQDANQSIISE